MLNIATYFKIPEHAEDIKMRNDSRPLTPGDTIKIPRFEISHNRAGDYQNYSVFLDKMINQLRPFLVTPQPPEIHEHTSFWEELVRVVAMAVAVVVAPQLAGPILLAMGSAATITGVTAAVTGVMRG